MSEEIPRNCFNCRAYGLAGDCLSGWCKADNRRVDVHDACAKWIASQRAFEHFASKGRG